MVNTEMLIVLRAVGSRKFVDSVWLRSFMFSCVASACTDTRLLSSQNARLSI